MCRTESRLARKADTWYSGCTKKVMFQKHTGTAILLKWLKPITVHEGAMSIIHYITLRAKPFFFFKEVFHLSCNKHVRYNRSTSRRVLGFDGQKSKWRIQQQSASVAFSLQVLEAASRVATYCNKVCALMRFHATEQVQPGAPQHNHQSNRRVRPRVQWIHVAQVKTNKWNTNKEVVEIHTSWKWTVSLCLAMLYSLNTTEIVSVRLNSDQGGWGDNRVTEKGMSMESSIAQANPGENIYEIYYILKLKQKRKFHHW